MKTKHARRNSNEYVSFGLGTVKAHTELSIQRADSISGKSDSFVSFCFRMKIFSAV